MMSKLEKGALSSFQKQKLEYADLHRRGNKHVPLTLSRWFKLPDFSIALQRNGLGIRLPHGPLLAGLKPSHRARTESDHSASRIV